MTRCKPAALTAAVLVGLLGFLGCAPSADFMRQLEAVNQDVVFSVSTPDSLVALTLDDGPWAAVTLEVLDVLARHDAQATFFLTGERIRGREGIVRQIVLQGHEIANHGMTETPSVLLRAETFRSELRKAHALLAEHDSVTWFRPATGLFNDRIIAEACSVGYRVALGDVYPNDVHRPLSGIVSRHVLGHVEPGSVIILHEGRTGRRTIVDVLERVLPELADRGYRVVTLSELVASTDADSRNETQDCWKPDPSDAPARIDAHHGPGPVVNSPQRPF